MAGWIVYNGFWNASGPSDPVRRLQAAGRDRGVELKPVPNTALTAVFDGGLQVMGMNRGDFALFWDKDVRLARAMEAAGVRLYNAADAVALCDDKAATHLALASCPDPVPMPRTLVAPMTYVHMDEGPTALFLRRAEEALGFPMVVKECFGSLGGQVYLAHDAQELRTLADGMAARPFIVQRFVSAAAGTDVRLYMVGGKLAAAMRRRSDTDFRANIGGGGHAETYVPTAREVELAARCCRILGLEIAGVDLLHDEMGQPLVCEVNSSAHMAGITACTGVDVAGVIVDYVLEREAARRSQGGAGVVD